MKTLIAITAAATMLSGCSLNYLTGYDDQYRNHGPVTLECPWLPEKTVTYHKNSMEQDYFLDENRNYVEIPKDCFAVFQDWKQADAYVKANPNHSFKDMRLARK